MHDPSSPYFQFDPSSIGWLHRRAKKDEQIINTDLVRIIEANPELVTDEVVREYVVKGLQHKLKAKRGRKRTTFRMLRENYIIALYRYLLPRLQARVSRERKGRRKTRGTLGPAEQLCELLGKRFGMEPESIRNLVSSQEISRNSMRASKTDG